VLQAVFWASVALILYTHAGYPLLLWLLARVPLLRRLPARLIGVGVRPEHLRAPVAPTDARA